MLSFAGLRMEGLGSLGTGVQSASDSIQLVHELDTGFCLVASDSRKLSVSFLSLLGTTATGTFRVETEVRVGSVVGAVPEPETDAPMLASLAAVGLMARCRT